MRIIPIAICLGAGVGLLVSAFIWGVVAVKNLVWSQSAWNYSGWLVFFICLVGGLVVGCINQFEHNKSSQAHDLDEVFQEVENIEQNELPSASHIVRRVGLGIASLGFGGPLGPEAPLIEIASQMSARLASVLRIARFEAVQISVAGALGALFGAPLALATDEATHSEKPSPQAHRFIQLGPEIIAGVTAFIVFKKLLPGDGFHSFTGDSGPDNSLIGMNLLWVAVAALLVGCVVRAFQSALPRVRRVTVSHVPGGAITAGLLGGAVLGVGGMTNKLVLFSGHHEIQELVDEHRKWSFLLGIMLLKIVVLLACLAGGWFGGQIFPMAFIGAALSLAVGDIVGSHASLMLAGVGFVAASTVGLRKPLLSLIFGLLFFPTGTWLAMALAAGLASTLIAENAASAH